MSEVNLTYCNQCRELIERDGYEVGKVYPESFVVKVQCEYCGHEQAVLNPWHFTRSEISDFKRRHTALHNLQYRQFSTF